MGYLGEFCVKHDSRISTLAKKIYNQKRSFDQNLKIWGQLPATKKEGLFIANEINANLLLKNEASTLNIQKIESPKIIHVASHSFFLSNKEDFLYHQEQQENRYYHVE